MPSGIILPDDDYLVESPVRAAFRKAKEEISALQLGNFTPASSATPSANGDLVIEATSDTSVTLKLKGSDGTVRSVVLTLS